MKKKLTLSVDDAIIREARAESKRTGKSISVIFSARFRRARTKRKKPTWSERWGGSLGTLTDADLQRDDKLGEMAKRIRAAKP